MKNHLIYKDSFLPLTELNLKSSSKSIASGLKVSARTFTFFTGIKTLISFS